MLWSIPALPLLCATLLYVCGRRWHRAVWALAAVALCAAMLLLALLAVNAGWTGEYRYSDTFTLQLAVTPVSALFVFTIPLIAAPIIAFAAYHEHARGRPRLLVLLLIFIATMELLVLAADLLTLLIAWEIVGACSWALINQQWRESGNARNAAWAFLVTRLGDLGLFVAVFAAWAATGSLAYSALPAIGGLLLPVFVGGLVLAAAAKSAQLPFSPWLFAAMAGPVSVSALLHAATMVAAGTFILIRLFPLLDSVSWFGPLIIGIGLTTALAGGVVAATHFHAKKLLAASTSAHYGLMWVAIGAGYPAIAALHFVSHAAVKAALFLAAGVAGEAAGSYDLKAMRLDRRLPAVAIASVVTALALAGMFPLGAAWSKEKIVTAAGHVAPPLAVATMLAGALCAVYAARFYGHAFGRVGQPPRLQRMINPETTALLFLAGLTVASSLLWWPGAKAGLGQLLQASLPSFKSWELIASLMLVAAGGATGFYLVRKVTLVGCSVGRFAAGWFDLPMLGQRLMVAPVQRCSESLARFDNHLVAARLSSIIQLANGLARFDNRVVDCGLMSAGQFTRWLARLNATVSEWLCDSLPTGLARLSANSARWAQELQTGLSHHYYTLTLLGGVSFVLLLIMGALF